MKFSTSSAVQRDQHTRGTANLPTAYTVDHTV